MRIQMVVCVCENDGESASLKGEGDLARYRRGPLMIKLNRGGSLGAIDRDVILGRYLSIATRRVEGPLLCLPRYPSTQTSM